MTKPKNHIASSQGNIKQVIQKVIETVIYLLRFPIHIPAKHFI